MLETNAPFTTDDDVRLAIRCGNEVAKIYVDDVVLTDCTSPQGIPAYKTSVTGKGTIKIQDHSNTNECILAVTINILPTQLFRYNMKQNLDIVLAAGVALVVATELVMSP